MLEYYFIIAFLLIGGLVFSRKNLLQQGLLFLFNILQWGLTIYECLHFRIEELSYFTPDAAALIMLIILSILSTTSSYHSVSFLKDRAAPPRTRAIYYSALCILIMAQTGAFLSSHVAAT